MIDIISASAGSGKTYTLTKNFISDLLRYNGGNSTDGYRHILAVTFTNKATDEMKGRILKELHILATDISRSDYYNDFVKKGELVPGFYKNEKSLSAAAFSCLKAILHDYCAFSVSTIDKFVQTTLKSFAFEIGQSASYRLEIDNTELIQECVDRILDSLEPNSNDPQKKELLDWICEAASQTILEGRSFNLDDLLSKMASSTRSEKHRRALADCGKTEDDFYSKGRIDGLRAFIDEFGKQMQTEIADCAQPLGSALNACGLEKADFTRGFLSEFFKTYSCWKPGDELPEFNPTTMKDYSNASDWFAKKNASLAAKVTPELEKAVRDMVELVAGYHTAPTTGGFSQAQKYKTVLLIRKNIYSIGLVRYFSSAYKSLLKEKNVMDIADSNSILNDIIDGCDTPFIYERIGTRYENFLLDEFQDTSRTQYDNFNPLLKESVDAGKESLVVGDIKQSIYRFRNSDWRLLHKDIKYDFTGQYNAGTLADNYRSARRIVDFNNAVFNPADSGSIVGIMDARLGEDYLKPLYKDVRQNVKRKSDGSVRAVFCASDKEDEALVNEVNAAKAKGFGYGDITVLVRTHIGGARAAAAMSAQGISVMTDDSVAINSSTVVRRLASLMSATDMSVGTSLQKGRNISEFLTKDLGIEIIKSYVSIYDLAERYLYELSSKDKSLFDREVVYIRDFMDIVQDFEAKQSGSLSEFLKYWDIKKEKANITSASASNAVRIMTVHKAKGLAAPYVIVAYLEDFDITYKQNESAWCPVEGLSPDIDGVYEVNLGSTGGTMFEPCKEEETRMAYSDNVNLLYVALTRAQYGMSIISRKEKEGRDDKMSEIFKQCLDTILPDKMTKISPEKDASEGVEAPEQYIVLYEGKEETLQDCKEKEEKAKEEKARGEKSDNGKAEPEIISVDCAFPTASEAKTQFPDTFLDCEFFSEQTSGESSARSRGIVLHDILSNVLQPSDLHKAITDAVSKGELSADEAPEVEKMLSNAISSVSSKGWFPSDPSQVLNERDIIGSNGEPCRPDRVIRKGNEVIIVDYKFGHFSAKYVTQILSYAESYRLMGYEVKSACLWFVREGRVEEFAQDKHGRIHGNKKENK